MIVILARLLLGKLLTDPDVKKAVIGELKELAARDDNSWDDEIVKRFDEAWDVIVPAVLSKAG